MKAFLLLLKVNYFKFYQVRGLRYEDFKKAMATIRPSLNKSKWEELERWNEDFGSNWSHILMHIYAWNKKKKKKKKTVYITEIRLDEGIKVSG